MHVLVLGHKNIEFVKRHFPSASFTLYGVNMNFQAVKPGEALAIVALSKDTNYLDDMNFAMLLEDCKTAGLSETARNVFLIVNDNSASQYLETKASALANVLPSGCSVYARTRAPGQEQLEYQANSDNGTWVLRATYQNQSQKEIFRGTSDELIRFLQKPENCHISSAAMREQFALN